MNHLFGPEMTNWSSGVSVCARGALVGDALARDVFARGALVGDALYRDALEGDALYRRRS